MSTQTGIELFRARADRAEADLYRAVVNACPGPHKPTQHRDGNPPWCAACGRTGRGTPIEGALLEWEDDYVVPDKDEE